MLHEIVLLVEDNPDHAVLVQALLDYRHLVRDVFVTQTMAEAKAYLLGEWPYHDPERNPVPSLIILDLWTDDGPGLDFLEWLQEVPRLSRIPVIVFTECRSPQVRLRAETLGVREYLLKPEGLDALGDAIEAVVRPVLRRLRRGNGPDKDSAQAG